jgi:hypothetical protein
MGRRGDKGERWEWQHLTGHITVCVFLLPVGTGYNYTAFLLNILFGAGEPVMVQKT